MKICLEMLQNSVNSLMKEFANRNGHWAQRSQPFRKEGFLFWCLWCCLQQYVSLTKDWKNSSDSWQSHHVDCRKPKNAEYWGGKILMTVPWIWQLRKHCIPTVEWWQDLIEVTFCRVQTQGLFLEQPKKAWSCLKIMMTQHLEASMM